MVLIIIVTFSSSTYTFDILKSKKKLLSLQPPIRISSYRILYQRNYMKKLCNEFESCRSNKEVDSITKYVSRGTTVIV